MASESDTADTDTETETGTDNADPPVRHVLVKCDAAVFSYDGCHLTYQDHRYAKDISSYIPPRPVTAESHAAEAGCQQPRQVNSQSPAWWQAQCIFRGLPSHGTVAELQERLRGHENDPIESETLERARRTFKRENADAREHSWVHEMSPEEKATRDPRRYLREMFPAGSTVKEPVLLTTHFVINIQETAEELGLWCAYTHAPTDAEPVVQMAKYWVVVGQERSAVTERVRMIERESQRLKREQEEGRRELRRKDKALLRAKQLEAKDAVARCKDWDVSGVWNISCPHIQEGWDVRNMTLKIYLERTSKGPQMFAELDFGAVAGVFRFERCTGEARITAPMKPYRDDHDDESGESDENENENDYNNDADGHDDSSGHSSEGENGLHNQEGDEDNEHRRHSPTPEVFYFGSTTQSSAKNHTWNYRCRGEDTADGFVEHSSDAKSYTITFCAPAGRTLQGTFGGSAFGDCTFTGVKVGVGGHPEIDISEEWAKRDE
ncbi:hypothetical protein LZ554_008908 [Drepanopeziza brunnea f. sp. 'monogermtubi']|nr:hypothetical protein LZ554_008908 [Drepanopeziza brunnea f. sp. 'monogermtubi']